MKELRAVIKESITEIKESITEIKESTAKMEESSRKAFGVCKVAEWETDKMMKSK